MAEFRKLDFVGDFQGARKNALTLQRQEGLLASERANAPLIQETNQLALDQAKRAGTQQKTSMDRAEALRQYKILNQTAKAYKSIPVDQWKSATPKIQSFLESQGVDISEMNFAELTPELNDQFIATSDAQLGKVATEPDVVTLSPGQKRFKDGKVTAEVAPTPKAADSAATAPTLPPSLAADTTPEQAQVLEDVFTASGGGDKGVKAVAAQKETFRENNQRANAPAILAERFPKATPAQLKQLQAAVDGGKTVADGFKAAGKIREKQRQVEKGDTFRQRALEVANRLLENDELDDVTGSIDAKDESFIPFGGEKFRGDNEANAIADIKEIGNILTADNLDIMTGVLSETDINIIRSLAAGGLDRSRSDERFREDLVRIRDSLLKALSPGGEGTQGGQETPQAGIGEITEDDIQETMRIHGMTREQVLNDPRLKG